MLTTSAVRGGKQGPAIGRDLEGGLKRGHAGVCLPGGIRRIRLRGDSWRHGKPVGYRLLPARVRQGVESCVAE